MQIAIDQPLEVGRQRSGEAPPFHSTVIDGTRRLVVAPRENTRVSRRHLRIEALSDGGVKITNESKVLNFRVQGGTLVSPGASLHISQLTVLRIDTIELCVDSPHWESTVFQPLSAAPSLPQPTAIPSEPVDETQLSLIDTLSSSFDSAQGELLLSWLRAATRVFQYSALSPGFLDQASRAVLEIVGLDFASVLRFEDGKWAETGRAAKANTSDTRFSGSILEQLLSVKKTITFHPSPVFGNAVEEERFDAAVAAPIMNESGEIIGALVAARLQPSKATLLRPRISKLQASIVELIAHAIASAWARLRYEAELAKRQPSN